MNIIKEIEKLKSRFNDISGGKPNCVKLGKTEMLELTDWYNYVSNTDYNKKKVKIRDGSMIMGLFIIKIPKKTYLEVGIDDVSRFKDKEVVLSSDSVEK